MSNGGNFGRYFTLLAAGAVLAGCASWSFSPPIKGNYVVEPWNLSAADAAAAPMDSSKPVLPTTGTFTGDLASDYSSLANAMDGPLHDYAGSDYFARKGLKAAGGEAVPPEDNGNWLIPLEVPDHFRSILADARARLVAVLQGDATTRAPALAARAQVSYDCWVERMEQDWWHSLNGRCRQDFEAALAQLTQAPAPAPAPAAAVHRYNVYFEFDKAALTPEARQIVNAASGAAKADSAVKIQLVGKADTVGTDAYNMGLSHRRANAVRRALQAAGIAANRVQERWVGFREPPVPTPPGVREPRNRVVEINLQ
ncbi:MAG TPA: OmpA family protein [Stellaceae bacterium]|nr:OmpA family protein [Stellaceae bacterium]